MLRKPQKRIKIKSKVGFYVLQWIKHNKILKTTEHLWSFQRKIIGYLKWTNSQFALRKIIPFCPKISNSSKKIFSETKQCLTKSNINVTLIMKFVIRKTLLVYTFGFNFSIRSIIRRRQFPANLSLYFLQRFDKQHHK